MTRIKRIDKLKDNFYLGTKAIRHNKEILYDYLNNLNNNISKPKLVKEYTQSGSAQSFIISGLDLNSDAHYIIDFSGSMTGIGVISVMPNGSSNCNAMSSSFTINSTSAGGGNTEVYYYKNNNIHVARFESASGGDSKAIIEIAKVGTYPFFKSSCFSVGTSNTTNRNMSGEIRTTSNITSLKFAAEQTTSGATLKNCKIKIYKV